MNISEPDLHLPTEIYILQDSINSMSDVVSRHGSRAILVTTTSDIEIFHQEIDSLSTTLRQSGIGCMIYDQLPPIPNTEDIDIAVSFCKKTNCDLIIGFGGPQSIHSAKAICLLTSNYIFCHDLFKNPQLPKAPLPLVTVPAYPVYGFEVMPMLVLEEIYEHTRKAYFNRILFPAATVVDPQLSLKATDETVMKNALCALALSTEAVISKQNNDIINTFALKAIDFTFRNLGTIYNDSQNIVPRQYIATASVMSGIAFSGTFLSASMAIALAIASRCDLDMESAMCVIAPHIMEFNLTTAPGKYVQMSKVMGEDVRDITVIEAAIKSVEAIRKLSADISIPQRLSHYNVEKNEFRTLANLALNYPFISNAPRPLTRDEIETILIAAY